MADSFDPYHKWLAIPPAEQPANHYRLLGLALFEEDLDTISIAADRQMTHVRTFQTGQHSALSQKLLNELAAARLCLLDRERKAAYDAELRAQLGEQLVAAPEIRLSSQSGIHSTKGADLPRPLPKARALSSEELPQSAGPTVVTDVASLVRSRPRSKPTWLLPVAVGGGLLALVLAVIVVLRSGQPAQPVASSDANKASLADSQIRRRSTSTKPSVTKAAATADTNAPAMTAPGPSKSGDTTFSLANLDRPIVPGVVADRIVLWNTHNDVHKDRGMRECRLILLKDGKEVWRQDNVEMPWSPDEDKNVSIAIPEIRFDRVRVETLKHEGVSGGLAEVEIFRGDRNLARGCPAVASCILDVRFPASKVTDGITTSFYNGYWLPFDVPGWVEVDLAFAEPRPCEGVQADKLVIWNSHNSRHNDRGALSITAKLLLAGQEVWSRDDLEIPWQPDEDRQIEIPIPPQQRFDHVRVGLNRFQSIGGSLAEVQVIQGTRNLAASCPVQGNGCLNHYLRPELVTDGIMSSLQGMRGFWCSYDNTGGWVEIDLSCNVPEIGGQNRRLGCYRALVDRDWVRGLPWLARSDDSDLRSLALLDESGTTDPNDLTLIGDGWWDRAHNTSETPKAPLLSRSLYSYGRALPRLGEFERERFRQRVRESLPLEGGAYLSFLEPSVVEHVWPDNNIYALPAVVNSVSYPFSLWAHPVDTNGPVRIAFNIEKKYRGLHGAAAINDSARGNTTAPITFTILGDQRVLWSSQPMQATGAHESFDVDVTDVGELVLQLDKPSDINFCHAVWLNPRLDLSPPSSERPRGIRAERAPTPLAANSQQAPSTNNTSADNSAMPAESIPRAKPGAESPQAAKRAFSDLAAEADKKLPAPDEDSRREAERKLRQHFKAQWSGGKEPVAKLAAARAIAEYGAKPPKDPVERFVLWEQVRELASTAGDMDLACEAVGMVCTEFNLDALALKQDCLAAASKTINSVDQAAALLDVAGLMILEAVSADNHPVAKKIATTAQTIAKKAKDPAQTKAWANHGRELAEMAKEFDQAQAAGGKLVQDGNDAAANFAVGHYDVWAKGDWSNGLPRLAKGDDLALQMLARDDLAHSGPSDTKTLAELMRLADKWWELAEASAWLPRYQLRRHAVALYKEALTAAGADERNKIEQRFIGLLAQDDGLPKWDLFDLSQTQIHDTFLRINASQGMPTLATYRGPIDVTLVARTDNTNIRLHAFVAGGIAPGVIWNWELNPRELRVHHVDGGLGTASVAPLEGNRWYVLRYVVTEREVLVTVDGVPVFQEAHESPRFPASAISVNGAYGSVVDVRKIIIKAGQ